MNLLSSKKQFGYSLIEMLIASTIFAAVLIGTFTIFSTVNKANKTIGSNREVAYSGYSFTESLAEIARYTTPSRTADGALGCAGGAGVGGLPQLPALTCQKGLYYDSAAKKLGINLFNNNAAGRQYVVYELTLVPEVGHETVTRVEGDYTVYTPSLKKYRTFTSGAYVGIYLAYEEFATVDTLIPNNVVILVLEGQEPFNIEEAEVHGLGALIGQDDVSLSLAAAGDVPASKLTINLQFADKQALFENPDRAALYPFQTAVTTRTFNITFSE